MTRDSDRTACLFSASPSESGTSDLSHSAKPVHEYAPAPAGRLAFVGDLDRRFRAFEVDTGDILWETRLGSAVSGFPISYAVDGKQYVAVPSGLGIFRSLTGRLSPDIYQPPGGSALHVFALPD